MRVRKIFALKEGEALQRLWEPRDLAEVEDVALRVARIQGEYPWHIHPEGPEILLVLDGEVILDTEEGEVVLSRGEAVLVPPNTPHRSRAEQPAVILLVEPRWLNTRGVRISR